MVEVLDRVLPVEDEEISAFARKAFEKQGMKIHTGAKVNELEAGQRQRRRLHLTLKDGKTETLTVDRVILAVGIAGNVENIGLEALGVKVENGHIVIGPYGETDVAGLYAIGDLAGAPWLAHKAMHEGVLCVEKIAGVKGVHPMDVSNIPGCTYCSPQIASVGLTEARRRKRPAMRSRSATSPSSATARRSRSARPRASSRRCSTPRPASCSARI